MTTKLMNTISSQKKAEVIIIGGGPVGLVTALKLTAAGISVIVIEKSNEPYAEPRASTFHPPTLDLLDELNITDKLLSSGRKSNKWQFSFFNSNESAVFNLDLLSKETNHPYRLQCEQINLVQEASKQLMNLNRDSLFYNTHALNISHKENEVTVVAEREGEKLFFSGKWLIGSDGANSIVRKSLNIQFKGDTYPTSSISINSSFPFHEFLTNLYGVNYFWANDWSFSMFRTKLFWRIGYSPSGNLSDQDAVNKDNVHKQLSKIVPNIDNFKIQSAVVYKIHKRLVKSFRKGRILLAGDAAHLNSPSGGFGMNGGIHDAFNLSEKLIKVFNGSDTKLLDLYSKQRKHAASEDIQKTSDSNYKKHREKDDKERLRALKELQSISKNKKKCIEYLRQTSLISSLVNASKVN